MTRAVSNMDLNKALLLWGEHRYRKRASDREREREIQSERKNEKKRDHADS